MRIQKSNGVVQEFDFEKLKSAIRKANCAVDDCDKINDESFQKVFTTIEKMLNGFSTITTDDLNDIIEKALMRHNKYAVAKCFILYRDNKAKNKKFNSIEEQALSLIDGSNESIRGDNANKQVDTASCQRDYLAGLVCKSIFDKTVPKSVMKAHKKKWMHFHDTDYSPLMPIWNCDLLGVDDMLQNGFQMGDTWIDSPKTFSTAANLLAQISLIVSGSQYGGQTISWAHLVPFVQKSRDYYTWLYEDIFDELGIPKLLRKCLGFFKKKIVNKLTELDVIRGIKTYQYQIICHQSSNGQTPFVSNNLNMREVYPNEMKDFAMILEKIFKRRIKGVKNSNKVYVGPLFPKLLYWTCDGLNLNKKDPYFYLSELAAKCNSIRCQPDINSEKKCREIKKGQVIPSMGCRSLLSPQWEEVKIKASEKLHYQYITETNVQYDGAYGKNYDYNRDEIYDVLPCDGFKNVVINFRGNSGWVTKFDGEEFTVLKPMVYGRFNSGVVTVNIPHAALKAVEIHKENGGDLIETFYDTLDKYFQIAREGLIYRTNRVKQIKAKNVPIHLMYGAIARMSSNETIADWIEKHPTLMSTSFGYIGLYETCIALIGKSNSTEEGQKLSMEILQHINDLIGKWGEEDKLNYSLYGTPEESLTYAAALALRRDFGFIEHITDKDYVVNSYHIDPREEISFADKLRIEGKYLSLTSGGAVSYIETPDLRDNPKAILDVMQFMHDHIYYAEFNRKMGVCKTCGYEGDIPLLKTSDGNFKFKCPNCGEEHDENLSVQGRICGYLGLLTAGNTNKGRLDDIFHRVLHMN